MPPLPKLSSILAVSPEALLNVRNLNTTFPVTVSEYLAAQWKNPSDVLSILFLWGPETIQEAVAQLAGRTITPVSFSFGWAAFAAKALLSVVGNNFDTLSIFVY